MLTASQCETVAFTTPWGEVFCVECTHARLEQDGGGGVDGFEPMIRYSADTYAGEESNQRAGEDGLPEGCTEDCEPFGLYCAADSSHEIVEPYHYGHDAEGLEGVDVIDESIGRDTDADA